MGHSWLWDAQALFVEGQSLREDWLVEVDDELVCVEIEVARKGPNGWQNHRGSFSGDRAFRLPDPQKAEWAECESYAIKDTPVH